MAPSDHQDNPQDTLPFLLGRMDSKMDQLLLNQATTNSRIESHGERLQALEGSKGWLMGAAAAIGTVVSLVIAWFTSK